MINIYKLFNLHDGEEKKDKVREDVVKNISSRGANLWILACAIFIASIGLNVNSTAVIIGAMLISPLMGPIVGSGFALATYDFELLKRSAKNLFIATLVGFVVSAFYFYISPFKEVQSELLARTSPNIYDVLIAFFGGTVGAISITRVEKGNPIPGVAIATALMPPLCTAGFGLATMNIKFIAGALYLYSINCFFIGVSTFLVLKYLKYKPIETANSALDKKVRLALTVVMTLLVIPSFYLAYNLLQEKKFTSNVNAFIQDEFTNKGAIVIYKNVNFSTNPKKIELAFLTKKFDSIEIRELNESLPIYQLNNAELIIKQNTSDIKQEILSEMKLDNLMVSEKDIQIKQLSNKLASLSVGNFNTSKEVMAVFPEIKSIAFGKADDYVSKDSTTNRIVIIYQAEETIDELKLKRWMQTKFNNDSILIFKQ